MSEKKIALVTGGSRGIGASICSELGKNGFHVVVHYHSNEAKAQAVADSITAQGGSASLCRFDLANEAETVERIGEVGKQFGRIDVLVNNAGVNRDGLVLRAKGSDFDFMYETNLRGTMVCSREAVRWLLKAKGGSILQISSVVGEMGNAGQSLYSATKAGLIGFTKSLAKELASRNIRVNAITPGYIDTEMTQALSEEQRSAITQNIPLGRMGKAEDVARLVAFMASENAAYLTGQVVGVNGGLYI